MLLYFIKKEIVLKCDKKMLKKIREERKASKRINETMIGLGGS